MNAPYPPHEIGCEDNLRFMRRLPSESFQLIATSPPYNMDKEYESRRSLEEWTQWQLAVAEEAVRLMDKRGSLAWQTGNCLVDGEIFPLDALLFSGFKRLGLKLRNRIVWHFGHGLHCRKRFSHRYETINWWTRGDDYIWNLDSVRIPQAWPDKRHYKGARKGKLSGNPLGKNPSDVWRITNVKNGHPEKTNHPCQFPVELIERLVLCLTNEGGAVLDPHMGSGSALIAALIHNRKAFGCDTSESYCAAARRRIAQLHAGTLPLLPMSRRHFAQRDLLPHA